MDNLTPQVRSQTMRRVKSRATGPELRVRTVLRTLGCRYTVNRRNLPGQPDIVLPQHHAVIFVHGCFWHMHRCKAGKKAPQTHDLYWSTKRTRNVNRDKQVQRKLRRTGWHVLVVWECQTRPPRIPNLSLRLARYLTAWAAA